MNAFKAAVEHVQNAIPDGHEPRWWSWANIIQHAHRLGIPNFQRGSVWDSANRTALLESIYEQSPCGSFVFWAPNDAKDPYRHGVPLRGFTTTEEPMWLVDGQQRTRAMLDTFDELICTPRSASHTELVRRADLEVLREIGTAMSKVVVQADQDTVSDDHSRMWVAVLPAMSVFDQHRGQPYFGRHSESRNVIRGSRFRRLRPEARLRIDSNGKVRPLPAIPIGSVPLAALLSPQSVFRDNVLREDVVTCLSAFNNDDMDFEVLDELLPWGPQFVTGYAYESIDNEQEYGSRLRWKSLHERRRERNVCEMVNRLAGLFTPQWATVIERFGNMLWGNRFAVGWLPSSDVSAAIDAYARINRAGVRVREEERALALLSRACPELLTILSDFIKARDGIGTESNRSPRALLTHESDRQMGFGFWMTTVTRYSALALLGGSARRWLGVSALAKGTFAYRLDRLGPNETTAGRKSWARNYASPRELIHECAQRATSALLLVDLVLSEDLLLDHRMARPSARALYPLIDLLFRIQIDKLEDLRRDKAFRCAIGRLLHWTLLAPYIDQPDLEQLIIVSHGISDDDDAPLSCWIGDDAAVSQKLRQAFGRYQRELLNLWCRKRDISPLPEQQQAIQTQLTSLAVQAFRTEIGNARSLQHPAVGWLYAVERRDGAREFSWDAQVEAFRQSGGRIGVKSGKSVMERLRRTDTSDLYPEKQHIVPFSIARQIVNKGGTRATASPANDIGNLTWLSRRQNGLDALSDRWTAMDRDQDAANLTARGMLERTNIDGISTEVLDVYNTLQNLALKREAWDDKATTLFSAFCKGRRDWMVKRMQGWLEEPLPTGASEWLNS